MQGRNWHLYTLVATIGLSACWGGSLKLSAESSTETATRKTTTSITGILRYKADAKRPWRFGRYYIKGTDKHLAEAVVELVPASPEATFPEEIARSPQTHLMDQENFMFVPETLAVQLGDKVRFKNSEDAFHNVMCLDDKPPFNVNLSRGQEHIHTPKIADGTIKPLNIRCVFHGSMKGWLIVVPHRYFQLTNDSGAFTFKNFPPGSYKLRVIHPAGGLFLETEARILEADHSIEWDLTLSPDHLKEQKN